MKSKKETRISQIEVILRMQTEPISVSEISEMLSSVNRKTIDRDIKQMAKEGMVIGSSINPQKFEMAKPRELLISMSVQEAADLLNLPIKSSLRKKLKKSL